MLKQCNYHSRFIDKISAHYQWITVNTNQTSSSYAYIKGNSILHETY